MPIILLSHSQIDTWLHDTYGCPLKWAYGKVIRLPSTPSTALILGESFHKALEYDTTALRDGLPPLTFSQLENHFKERLIENIQEQDPYFLLSDQQIDIMYDRGLIFLQTYLDDVQPRFLSPNRHRIIASEEWIPEVRIEQDGLIVVYRGRIDAATYVIADDGSFVPGLIIDFKTASRNWLDGDQHTKDQATGYLLSYGASTNPLLAATKNVLFSVFTRNKVQLLQTRRDPAQLFQYKQKIWYVGTSIHSSVQAHTYSSRPGQRCKWCSYHSACPAGTAYMQRNGVIPVAPAMPKEIIDTHMNNLGDCVKEYYERAEQELLKSSIA
jgi:hypothetical protein